jgi:hypothetical protein
MKSVIYRSCVAVVLPGMLLAGSIGPAFAKERSCRSQIVRAQVKLDKAVAQHAKSGPPGRQTTAATRDYQPTPNSMAKAEAKLDGWDGGVAATKALDQARAAEAAGDQTGCRSAVQTALQALAN